MRREYVGGAQSARLTSSLGDSAVDLTIVCNNLTNWPTGAGGRPFYVVIDRGLSSEEKILCASRSGNTLSVYDDGITNGRGSDDTSITAHSSNAVIEHIFTATDADEANAVFVEITGATDGYILVGDSTEPYNVRWSDPEPVVINSVNIINPFLLMGA